MEKYQKRSDELVWRGANTDARYTCPKFSYFFWHIFSLSDGKKKIVLVFIDLQFFKS